MFNRVFIIAEAGVNHNGRLEIAKKMVDAAKYAGADAVKFQTFKSEALVSANAQKADYQKHTSPGDHTQLKMLKKLELNFDAYQDLLNCCRRKKIIFLSTAFDLESLSFISSLGLKIFKVPSGEITNLPYLRKIGALKKKVVLSTGMSNLREIKYALDVLTESGTKKEDITILHCNSEYPTPFKDVNLKAMVTIKNKFKVGIGYSDHTLGIEVSIAAVALGARVIEKHFTLSRKMSGPDHQASLEPGELKNMVMAIRNIEQALGNGIKKPSPSEYKNISAARKSIVAARPINKGEVFCDENITVKRPGSGISPFLWDRVIGRKSKRDFKKDEFIEI